MSVLYEIKGTGWRQEKDCSYKSRMPTEQRILRFKKEFVNFYLKKENTLDLSSSGAFYYLQRKRAERMKSFHLEVKPVFYYRNGNDRPCEATFYVGEHHVFSDVEEKISLKTVYLRNGISLYESYRSPIARYTVIEPLREDRYFICPICEQRNVQSSGYTRCSSCGKIFYPEDLEQRVVTFGFFRTGRQMAGQAEGIMRKCRRGFVLVCSVVGMLGGFSLTVSDDGFAAVLYGCFAMAVAGGLAILAAPLLESAVGLVRKFKKFFLRKNCIAPEDLELKIRQEDSSFSVNVFMGYLDTVLQLLHLAETPADYRMFVCETIVMPEEYQKILDCYLKRVEFQSYTIDGSRRSLQLKAHMEVLKLEEDEIAKYPELAELVLTSSTQSDEPLGEGFLGGCCFRCGAKLSIKEGRNCPECGQIQPENRCGWIITTYRILN